MEFNVKRDQNYLKELKDCIINNYGLNISKITKASRGVDGETWIAIASRKRYFVKISYYLSHKARFINSIKTLNILNKNKIKYLNSIIKTNNGEDYTNFNNGILAIYTYVKGEIDYRYPYNKLIRILTPVYKIKSDFKGLTYEDLKIKDLISRVKNEIKSPYDSKLSKVIGDNLDKLNVYLNGLEYYYNRIDKNTPMYITHGDACVNVMVSRNEKCLIDWDDSIVAPIERDCWFFIDSKEKISYINKYFKRNQLNYKLSTDMLFFYAYKRAVEYIDELINKYKTTSYADNLDEINEILNGWVSDKLESIKKVWGGHYDANNI